MNVVAEIQRLNERELELNVPLSASWHQKYRESAWVYVGGLPFELSEGDVLCVLSQFGEVEDIHLVRDGKTGKPKGFAFLKFEDQRSTVLAVDNLNGFRLLDRVLRVDHVLKYKLPKELQEDSDSEDDEQTERRPRGLPGHAYEGKAGLGLRPAQGRGRVRCARGDQEGQEEAQARGEEGQESGQEAQEDREEAAEDLSTSAEEEAGAEGQGGAGGREQGR